MVRRKEGRKAVSEAPIAGTCKPSTLQHLMRGHMREGGGGGAVKSETSDARYASRRKEGKEGF